MCPQLKCFPRGRGPHPPPGEPSRYPLIQFQKQAFALFFLGLAKRKPGVPFAPASHTSGGAAMGLDAVLKAGGEAPVRIDVLATSSAAPAAAPDAVPEAAAKRPRGRPPKARQDCALVPAVSKRPRGRPPGEDLLRVVLVQSEMKQRTDTGSLRSGWVFKVKAVLPLDVHAQVHPGPVRQARAKTRRRPLRLPRPSSGHRIWCGPNKLATRQGELSHVVFLVKLRALDFALQNFLCESGQQHG